MTNALETRIMEYWDWISVALFLLVTVDLLTTIYAASMVGPTAEANPLTRWLLGQGPVVLALANVAVVVVVVFLFNALMELLRVTPDRLQAPFMRGIELWLGVLLAAGLGIFANNLVVIFGGISLL